MRRCDGVTPPDYYRWPLRRPSDFHSAGLMVVWDQAETWTTASEWLAWLRRRYPNRRAYLCWGPLDRWAPVPRPIIVAGCLPWSTKRVRKLP